VARLCGLRPSRGTAFALEALCKEHDDIDAEIEGARRISTFGDEGMAGCDPDDPDDCDDETGTR